jgi:hypothetical protein
MYLEHDLPHGDSDSLIVRQLLLVTVRAPSRHETCT